MQVNAANTEIETLTDKEGFLEILKNVSRRAENLIQTNIYRAESFHMHISNTCEDSLVETVGLKDFIDDCMPEYNLTSSKKHNATVPIFSDIAGSIIDKLDSDTKDGKIGFTKQGATGDCWLLSGVNAINSTEKGREIIKNSLEYTDNGVIVHLKGAKDYTVSNLEIAQTKASYQYSDGDDDMIALELAIEKTLNDIANANYLINDYFSVKTNLSNFDKYATRLGCSSTSGGLSHSAIYLITGKAGGQVYNKDFMEYYLDEFQKNDGKDFALAAGVLAPPKTYNTKNDGSDISKSVEPKTVIDVYGNTVELAQPHSYSIKNVDSDNVTFVNPWDSSIEYTVSREIFLENFDSIDYCDLSDKNPEKNMIEEPIITRDNGDKLFYRQATYDIRKPNSEEFVPTTGMELIAYTKNGKIIDSVFSPLDDVRENEEIFNKAIEKYINNFTKTGSFAELN